MSTATLKVPFGTDSTCLDGDPLDRRDLGVHSSEVAPVVVAVDGTRAAGAALRVAAAVAARDQCAIEAILVEGVAPAGTAISLSGKSLRDESLSESSRLGRVRQQLSVILGDSSWNLHVECGSFGPTVAKLARTSGASLIVLGLSRHRRARRLLGKGAVARVLQSAQTAVLAVEATARGLPHTALAAIDFSPASLRAAREARDLLDRPGTLHLLHVRPAPSESVSEIEWWNAAYAEGAAIHLDQLAADLTIDGVKVVASLVSGAVTKTLLRAVDDLNAELIACGAETVNAVDRFLVGHTPLQLLRRAECSVLISTYISSLDASEESR